MTEKLKRQLILGTLAWGLFIFQPCTAEAQFIGPSGADKMVGAQIIRAGGQDAVDRVAANAGYKSDNIKAVSFQDAADLVKKGTGANNITGAYSAAKVRMSGSKGFFSGAWNVVKGAAKDLFRSSDEIAADLQKYKTDENAKYYDMAVAAAKDVQGDGSSILGGNIKSIPDKVDQLRAAASAVAVYETPEGQKIYMDKDMKSIGGMMDGCVPLPLKLEQSKKCILCPLFVILFNTAQTMGSASYDALAGGFKNLLLIGFALYVAYVTLKQVSSFTKQDGPKYVSDLLTMSFKVLLAFLILSNVTELYQYLLEPMLSAAMDFGGAFLFRSASSHSDNSFMSCASATEMADGVTIVNGYYSAALFAKVDCFVRSIQQELAVATSIGSSLMCVSHNEAAHWYGLPDITMLASGLLIWVFSWLVCLAFGFYLIDSVVRLGVIGGLMPFLIAAWPFKLTSGYTKKGWDMFMNTFFTFVFLGLVVSVNIELGLQAITGGEGGYDKIMELVNKNEVKPLVEIMSIGLTGILFLILCCIFGFKLCGEAVSLASQMGGGTAGTIGANIASLGAGAAKWGAKNTLKGAGKVTGDIASGISDGSGLTKTINKKREDFGKSINNFGAKLGRSFGLVGADAAARGSSRRGGAAPVSPESEGGTANSTQSGIGGERGRTGASSDGFEDRNSQRTVQSSVGNEAGNENRNVDNADPENKTSQNVQNAYEGAQEPDRNDNNTNETPVADGGAATASPREFTNDTENNLTTEENQRGRADQTVAEARDKISAAAQDAASEQTQNIQVQQSGKFEDSKASKKGDDKKNSEELKQAKAQIEDLKKQINILEIEKDKLEKQLKLKTSGGVASGTTGSDAEKLRKIIEEKEKAEAKLSALQSSMGN